jgi:membrane protein DedA with SNARE-associated domain
MINEMTHFLIRNGGLILFVVGFGEQSGLPFPGGLFLVAAGALAASGQFSLLSAIGWATAGCVAADAIWFSLGHRDKVRVFRVFPHLPAVQVKLERAKLAKTILHGSRMLTVAKFVPLGNLIPMHAGAMEVNRLRFLVVDAFSAAVYAAVYAALGFAFHNQLEQVVAFLRKLGTVSIPVFVVAVAAYVVYAIRQHRRAQQAPEPVTSEGN